MSDAKKIILFIEDEDAYQRALIYKLSLEGFRVLSAKNGIEGVQIALEHHPDLILLDLLMPKMGGIEVLKELKKDPWGKNVKIIVLSNINDSKKIAEVVLEGTYDYYVKADANMDELVARIKTKINE